LEHDLAVVLHDKIHWLNPGCSNFGAWGDRTANGALYSGRNLDWESDTGVNKNKLITVTRLKASRSMRFVFSFKNTRRGLIGLRIRSVVACTLLSRRC